MLISLDLCDYISKLLNNGTEIILKLNAESNTYQIYTHEFLNIECLNALSIERLETLLNQSIKIFWFEILDQRTNLTLLKTNIYCTQHYKEDCMECSNDFVIIGSMKDSQFMNFEESLISHEVEDTKLQNVDSNINKLFSIIQTITGFSCQPFINKQHTLQDVEYLDDVFDDFAKDFTNFFHSKVKSGLSPPPPPPSSNIKNDSPINTLSAFIQTITQEICKLKETIDSLNAQINSLNSSVEKINSKLNSDHHNSSMINKSIYTNEINEPEQLHNEIQILKQKNNQLKIKLLKAKDIYISKLTSSSTNMPSY